MPTIGYASLQIIPSIEGITGQMNNQLTGPMQQSGQAAGRAAGQGMATGLQQSQAAVQKAADNLAKARDKEADAAGKVRVAEQKLEDARGNSRTTAAQLAAAEERLASEQRKLDQAQRNTSRSSTDLARAEEQVTAATEEAARAADGATESTDKLGLSALATKENMLKLGAAVGASMVAAGAALFAIGSTFDDVSDTIRIGTGATGESLAGLEQSAKNVATNIPASFEDVATSIADLNTRLGLTGPTLETLSSQILMAGDMLGEAVDVGELTAAFSAFGVKGDETTEVMDELWQVSQATGVGLNELTASAVKGGPALQQFGFGLSDSAALVGMLDKSGLDADKTLGAMNKSLMAFAKDGKDPQEALYNTAREIEGFTKAGNDAAALDVASKLFGTKGAGQFVEAVKNGTFSIDDLIGAAGASGDTILGAAADTADFAEQWMMFKNQVLVGLEPLATAVFGAITGGMIWIKDVGGPAITSFGQTLSTVFAEGGPLGDFASIATGVGSVVLPGLWSAMQMGAGIVAGLAEALASAVGWFREHEVVAGILAGVITVGLLPALVSMTVGFAASAAAAVASGATTAAIWVMLQASAVTSAAAQVAAQYRTVAGWVASAASAVASGATTVASYVATGAAAVLQAGIAAGAWVASSARTVAALAMQATAFVAQKAIFVAGAVATGVMTAAQWALNAAMSANPIGLLVAALAALVAGIVIAYQNSETFRNIVQAAWQGIQDAVSFAWNNVIKPIFDFWWAGVQKAGEVVTWLWNNAVQPAFDGIGNLISGTWNNVISPSFEAMKTGFGAVGDFFGGVSNVIQGVWDGIVNGIKSAVRMIGGLLSRLKNVPGLGWVGDAGMAMMDWAGSVPGRATGGLAGNSNGVLWGPGTGTSDSILGIGPDGMPTVRVATGEFLTREKAVTPETLPVLRAINSGWVPPAWLLHEMVPGLAGGGLVSANDLAAFAQGVEGQPYEWGGVNWGDCSGAVSAIANYATGRDPFGSRFATMTMDSELAARGFLPGLGPAGSLNVGWYNGGEYGGHTAATLPNGVNFEMGGQRGDGQYGGIAAGAADSMFTDHAHLPPDFFIGGDALPSGVGDIPGGLSAGGGSGGGWSAPSTGGGGGGGMSGGGGGTTSGGSAGGSAPAGAATPVFVTNWPNGTPTGTGQAPATEAYAPGGTGAAPAYTGEKAASWQDETSKNFQTGMAGAGQAFVDGQLAGMPFGDTIGKVRDRGKEITIIVQDMHEAISKIRTLEKQQALAPGSRF